MEVKRLNFLCKMDLYDERGKNTDNNVFIDLDYCKKISYNINRVKCKYRKYTWIFLKKNFFVMEKEI